CGVGFGEAVRDALAHDVPRAGDLRDARALREKVEDTRARLWSSLASERDLLGEHHDELAPFADRDLIARWIDAATALRDNVVPDSALAAMLREGDVVLEGAQGVLLDERYGFHPHTTWSDCTPRAASTLLTAHGFAGPITRLGVLRTYLTRHGEGPFPTERAALAASLPEQHNSDASWQGRFRVGLADLVLARYALRVSGGLDALAITHLDREPASDTIATHYARAEDASLFVHDEHGAAIDLRAGDLEHQARLARALRDVDPILAPTDAPITERLAHELRVPLAITSSGPTAAAKRWTSRA
ncbi:MAG: adenylosuccinate synthetase, partial [Myxococcota bacterium]|nr:adenylosuccinate synthetase [Myxococcota bacterium]